MRSWKVGGVLLFACTGGAEPDFVFQIDLGSTEEVARISVDDPAAQIELHDAYAVVTRSYASYVESTSRPPLGITFEMRDGSTVVSAARPGVCVASCMDDELCPTADDITFERLTFGPPFVFQPGDHSCVECKSPSWQFGFCP